VSGFDRTVAAALRIVADASVDDFLALLTIEALRNEMAVDERGQPAPSSRTIGQAFSAPGRDGQFDRSVLAQAMLVRTIDDMVAVASASIEGYLQAADTVRRGGGPEAFTSVIARDLGHHEAGGHAATNARERVFNLFVALSDDEPAMARHLRRFLSRYVEVFEPLVEVYVKLFNRRLASGVSSERLYLAIHCYLRGVTFYSRCGVNFDAEIVSETVLRILWSHTTPVAGVERNPIGELWNGVAPPTRHRSRP
jgi:hypothetical protein